MQISAKTWHYRLVLAWFDNASRDLCNYFWQVVGSVLITLCMLLALTGVAFGLSLPLWWWLTSGGFRVDAFPIAALFGFLDTVMLIITWRAYREHLRMAGKIPPEGYKPPSLLAMKFRAHKEKICPRLEFTYDD